MHRPCLDAPSRLSAHRACRNRALYASSCGPSASTWSRELFTTAFCIGQASPVINTIPQTCLVASVGSLALPPRLMGMPRCGTRRAAAPVVRRSTSNMLHVPLPGGPAGTKGPTRRAAWVAPSRYCSNPRALQACMGESGDDGAAAERQVNIYEELLRDLAPVRSTVGMSVRLGCVTLCPV